MRQARRNLRDPPQQPGIVDRLAGRDRRQDGVLIGQTGGGQIFTNNRSEIAGARGNLNPWNFAQVGQRD
ncbi:MAG: hypothetical protein ACK40H_06725, partial [Sphingomonadaceae bacterium]